mmetsp:Transcript_33475/g.66374  ORF Transcript_33475/g.66374 Transcript_33475/m.66374 type:complete len:106 (+) Transcript_33475:597-914(+)
MRYVSHSFVRPCVFPFVPSQFRRLSGGSARPPSELLERHISALVPLFLLLALSFPLPLPFSLGSASSFKLIRKNTEWLGGRGEDVEGHSEVNSRYLAKSRGGVRT